MSAFTEIVTITRIVKYVASIHFRQVSDIVDEEVPCYTLSGLKGASGVAATFF